MKKFYESMMKKCLKLALKGEGLVSPNPMVGCIVCNKKGEIITSGYHQKYGENHAERNALINTDKKDLKDSILFVNLEPCSHQGKTPPCADLIIEKGIKEVVVAMIDPNPLVSESGIRKLENAGIKVTKGILEKSAKDLNKVFIKNILYKKPYVMIKCATTMDAKIATDNGHSKWITGDKSRKKVMEFRAKYDAIMTGSGTVLADDPSLTARIKGAKNPIRIIMDRSGKIPLDKKVFINNTEKIIVVTNSEKQYPSYITKIEFKDFDTLFKELYLNNIYKVMVEAGSTLVSEIIKAKEADELNQFIAPKILGCGISFAGGFCTDNVNDSTKLKDLTCRKYGNDVLINAKFVYDK